MVAWEKRRDRELWQAAPLRRAAGGCRRRLRAERTERERRAAAHRPGRIFVLDVAVLKDFHHDR